MDIPFSDSLKPPSTIPQAILLRAAHNKLNRCFWPSATTSHSFQPSAMRAMLHRPQAHIPRSDPCTSTAISFCGFTLSWVTLMPWDGRPWVASSYSRATRRVRDRVHPLESQTNVKMVLIAIRLPWCLLLLFDRSSRLQRVFLAPRRKRGRIRVRSFPFHKSDVPLKTSTELKPRSLISILGNVFFEEPASVHPNAYLTRCDTSLISF